MVISTVQQESFEGENFCETDDFLQIARFCRTKRCHAPKFAEKTFTADTQKTSLEPRLYVPDFVSQLWRKIGGKAWKDLARDTVAP